METGDGNKKNKKPYQRKCVKKKLDKDKSSQKLCCRYCYETFPYPSRLAQHMKIHTNVQTYECSQCAARFKYPNSLKTHEDTHKRVKKFECPNCSMTFEQRSDLTKHTITHRSSTMKPTDDDDKKCHKCEKCQLIFDNDTDLTLHKRTLQHINR